MPDVARHVVGPEGSEAAVLSDASGSLAVEVAGGEERDSGEHVGGGAPVVDRGQALTRERGEGRRERQPDAAKVAAATSALVVRSAIP